MEDEPYKSYLAVLSMNLAFAISLFGKEIWATLVILTFCNGLVYCYECTGSDLSGIRPSLIRRIIFETWTIQGLTSTFTIFPVFKRVFVVFIVILNKFLCSYSDILSTYANLTLNVRVLT